MAITITEDKYRTVRSKIKLSPTAFEESLPEGTTMDDVNRVDSHRADFLEAAIRTGTTFVANTLIGTDETSAFKTATLEIPLGGDSVANVVIKPHGDAIGTQIKVDTTLTANSEGVMSGVDFMINYVKSKQNVT